MTIDVIPLRRLPTSLPMLSYRVPDHLRVNVGSFIRVPFRGRSIDAITWNTASTYEGDVRDIDRVVTEHPVVSAWQRFMIDTCAVRHATTQTQLLHLALPSARTLASVSCLEQTPTPSPARTYWYTSRREALDVLRQRIMSYVGTALILCATKESIDEITAVLPEARRLDGDTSQREYGKLYVDVSAGTVRCVVGTYTALFLPFPTTPTVIIDQEEMSGHQQTQRSPYVDPRVVLEAAGVPVSIFSPAPSLRFWRTQHPLAPKVSQVRTIGRLDQGTIAPLLSAAVHTDAPSGETLWLLPRRGFAGSISCRQCNWIFACPSCQRTMRWAVRQSHQATCNFCRHVCAIPLTCPTCHSANVGYNGFSSEKLQESLTQTGLGGQHTISSYHDIPAINPQTVIHVCGETLLQVQDFSADERAWQMLHRISARFPEAHHIVQTYRPDFPTWQYWATGQPDAWYTQAIDERQRLHLPPAADSWTLHWLGADGLQEIAEMRKKLIRTFGEKLALLEPPVHQKTSQASPRYRLMISSRTGERLHDILDWQRLFPAPWTIDTSPQGWLV